MASRTNPGERCSTIECFREAAPQSPEEGKVRLFRRTDAAWHIADRCNHSCLRVSGSGGVTRGRRRVADVSFGHAKLWPFGTMPDFGPVPDVSELVRVASRAGNDARNQHKLPCDLEITHTLSHSDTGLSGLRRSIKEARTTHSRQGDRRIAIGSLSLSRRRSPLADPDEPQ
jgi:hypothetical protein